MLVAHKWFVSFNGFHVYLTASDSYKRSIQGLHEAHPEGSWPSTDDAATVIASGNTAANRDHSECILWVEVGRNLRATDWTPIEVAAHEAVHAVAHLLCWMSTTLGACNEPAAYLVASIVSMYDTLIDFEEGRASGDDVRYKANELDFSVFEIPGLGVQHES